MKRIKLLITLITSAIMIISAFAWLIGSDACVTPAQNVIAFLAIIAAILMSADAIERAGE